MPDFRLHRWRVPDRYCFEKNVLRTFFSKQYLSGTRLSRGIARLEKVAVLLDLPLRKYPQRQKKFPDCPTSAALSSNPSDPKNLVYSISPKNE
jgi:hypothetical protein